MDKKMNARKKAQRAARRRQQRNRRLVSTVCLMLAVMVFSVAGTIAWLTDDTDPVTNTFTAADIGITLTETPNYDSNSDGTADKWQAQLIPNVSYTKDPVVTVKAEDTDIQVYLFVKVDEGNCATYLDYTLAWNYESTLADDATESAKEEAAEKYAGWTKLTGVSGVDNVWYRVVNVEDADQSWHLLVNDTVVVKNLTENTMATANQELKFTAYACQYIGFEDNVADAWAQASSTAD